MLDPAPFDVVRSRFPSTPADDRAELQEYAEHLDRLRKRVSTHDLQGLEIALTFDARGSQTNE